MIRKHQDSATPQRDSGTLSPRQLETLALLGAGLTNEEAAARMNTARATVDTQRARINRKLGARGTGILVRHAIRIRLKLVGTDVKLVKSELTPREEAILGLLGEGLGSESTARKLGVSAKTVDAYRARLNRKLGAWRLADLIRYAIHVGLASRP